MEEKTKSTLDDEKSRTLYVRWPKAICDDKEVMRLFSEEVKVKLPRQKSRCCHVVFSTIQKKEDCLETMKDKLTVDGKRIVLLPLVVKNLDRRKNKSTRKSEAQKKVAVPRPQQEPSTRSLFVTDIPKETTTQEVKKAFPGCKSLALLKTRKGKKRTAVVKMSKVKFATAYLNSENPPPVIHGTPVKIFPYKKKSKSLNRKLQTVLKNLEDSNEIKDESDDSQS